MDGRLGAGLDAGHPVAHAVETGLGGVDLDEVLELGLAALQLVLPQLAFRLAIGHHLLLRVLALTQHFQHVAWEG